MSAPLNVEGMHLPVIHEELANPRDIGDLGSPAVVTRANGITHLVQQLPPRSRDGFRIYGEDRRQQVRERCQLNSRAICDDAS